MWVTGERKINGSEYEYEVKYFDEKSEYGIDGGRIIKLHVWCDDEWIALYEWGWGVVPTHSSDEQVVEQIIREFN